MSRVPQSVWDVGATLGEGPLWCDDALWFVDIKSHKLHRFQPDTDERRSWDAPQQIGFIVPARSGGMIAGLQSGLHRFDPNSGAFELLVEVEPERPSNRLNDAVVDRQGRLWFGTMDDSERDNSGAYYCFHRGELRPTSLTGVAITNGPAVSPNGRILYWVDTIGGGIFACDIDGDGSLGEPRPFVKIPPAEGHPDGPTVDSNGYLWIGLYGGSEARRYSPGGDLVERVRFPVANITKVALGGPDLRTAYATTARHHLAPAEIERQPQAGDLFAFRVDVPGVECALVDD